MPIEKRPALSPFKKKNERPNVITVSICQRALNRHERKRNLVINTSHVMKSRKD